MQNEVFIEVDHCQMQKAGNEICGDVFLSNKINAEKRTIIILSDGLGSGIKANILASMTASMALNFMKVNSPIEHTARIIMNTLPVDNFRMISFSSFTIIDIQGDKKVRLMEYGNPHAIIWKDGHGFEPVKTIFNLSNKKVKQNLYTSEFEIELNDRIFVFSDGITQSGMGTRNTPFGWGREQLNKYVALQLENTPEISAGEIAGRIIKQAIKNDGYQSRDDMSCGAVYFREPRKILFCTGPPYKYENDAYLAERIKTFRGVKIISGGTTAQIVSRLLNIDIDVKINKSQKGLPPESAMEGIDLVTEGILTLGKVSEYLETSAQLPDTIPGPAGSILKHFKQNDEIFFLVGTRVNEAHQDPNLPVELEIRRNVIKKIARLLEEKFLKRTEIAYI